MRLPYSLWSVWEFLSPDSQWSDEKAARRCELAALLTGALRVSLKHS
jgi:hypothetical protein